MYLCGGGDRGQRVKKVMYLLVCFETDTCKGIHCCAKCCEYRLAELGQLREQMDPFAISGWERERERCGRCGQDEASSLEAWSGIFKSDPGR